MVVLFVLESLHAKMLHLSLNHIPQSPQTQVFFGGFKTNRSLSVACVWWRTLFQDPHWRLLKTHSQSTTTAAAYEAYSCIVWSLSMLEVKQASLCSVRPTQAERLQVNTAFSTIKHKAGVHRWRPLTANGFTAPELGRAEREEAGGDAEKSFSRARSVGRRQKRTRRLFKDSVGRWTLPIMPHLEFEARRKETSPQQHLCWKLVLKCFKLFSSHSVERNVQS